MRATPLAQAPSFPVTVVTAAVALGVTFAYWSDGDLGVLFMTHAAFWREPWRLVTSIFPHAHLFHLLFNVVWLWIFGTWIERELGHVKLFGLLVVTAAVSSAAQHAAGTSGIGLSGAGYGLFGFLWATARFDERRADAMDPRTVRLFLGWGLLCLGLTMLGVWKIANTAHAVGLLVGFALGAARALKGARRAGAGLGLVIVIAASFVGATVARPFVAVFDRGGHAHCYDGYLALKRDDNARAVQQLELAARYPEPSAGCVFNRGIALSRVGRFDEASVAYEEAVARDPSFAEQLKQGAEGVEPGAATAADAKDDVAAPGAPADGGPISGDAR